MKILALDTNFLIYWYNGEPNLRDKAKEIISEFESQDYAFLIPTLCVKEFLSKPGLTTDEESDAMLIIQRAFILNSFDSQSALIGGKLARVDCKFNTNKEDQFERIKSKLDLLILANVFSSVSTAFLTADKDLFNFANTQKSIYKTADFNCFYFHDYQLNSELGFKEDS